MLCGLWQDPSARTQARTDLEQLVPGGGQVVAQDVQAEHDPDNDAGDKEVEVDPDKVAGGRELGQGGVAVPAPNYNYYW